VHRVRLVKELSERKQLLEEADKKGNKSNIKELKLLIKAIEQLKQDFKAGQILPKKTYPSAYKEYTKKYGAEVEIDNLWVLKISGDWRVIYTVIGNEVEIISFILDTMTHKKYERKLNFG